jgi:hypothetical protein
VTYPLVKAWSKKFIILKFKKQKKMKTSDRLIVTLKKYNRKGSNDSFFFKVEEAFDFESGRVITAEQLGDAGAIGWNTNGFQGIQAHFETGSEATCVVDVVADGTMYTDKAGIERENLSFSLVNDITELERAKTKAKAMAVLNAKEAPVKVSRFAPKATPAPAPADTVSQTAKPADAVTADATAETAKAAK